MTTTNKQPKSREYVTEGATKAYMARISYYRDGRIAVMLSKLGPFFWDAFKHEMFVQEELAELQFKAYCEEADSLAGVDE